MKLNLGCGRDIRKGWINLDQFEGKGIDVVHNLNLIPLPFEDNKFDLVLCQDILEHIEFIPLINDIYRILKLKGLLVIRVPHFTSKLNYDDPTHINRFSLKTFDYFIKNDYFNYEREVRFYSRIKKKIIFDKSSLIMKVFHGFIEKLINKSEKRQIFYETSFLKIIPAMNLEITLKK